MMDVDAKRLKRRKKWLLLSIAPITVFLLAAIKLVTPTITTSLLQSMYEEGNYNAAQFWGTVNSFINIIEPYKAHFNNGTVLFRLHRYIDAEKELNQALLRNPPKDVVCEVRVNLALSIEAQADILSEEKKYDESIILYDKARTTLYGDNCASPNDMSGDSGEAEESEKRIEGKKNDTVMARNNDQPEEGEEGNPTEPTEPAEPTEPVDESSKQDLQKKLQDAQKSRSESQSYSRGRELDEDSYDRNRPMW